MRGQSPNSGYKAGDGSYLPNNEEARRVAGDDFVKTAFSLKQGQVSRVIEGLRGYQIIKITETYPRKDLALDDFVQPGTRMTVRDYIGNGLLQEQQQKILAQATEELVNELRTGNTFQVFEKNLNW
jgi:parvulin-like peptidyl-prolyl isomerase